MNDNGLKVVEGRRISEKMDNDIVKNKIINSDTGGKLIDVVTNNFSSILSLANDIVEIKRMSIQSQAIISKMNEDRKNLLAEAEAYANRKNADTNSIIKKMRVIQEMMKDFYQHNNSNMTGEDFSKVITEIVTQMGRIE